MKKRLLAWMLAGVMVCTMMPLDVSAAERQGMGGAQGFGEQLTVEQSAESFGEELFVGESQRGEGEQSAGEKQKRENAQGSGGSLEAGENQTPGESLETGGGQKPGESLETGEEQKPGENQGTGENQGPGENQGTGEEPGSGENQKPGENQGTEEGPGSGESQDPGADPNENHNSGGNQKPEQIKKPGENANPPGAEENGEMPADHEENPAEGAAKKKEGEQQGDDSLQAGESEEAEAFSGVEAEGLDTQSIENWGVPLDGMDVKYLEVPSEVRSQAKGLDGSSVEVVEHKAGIALDVRGSQKYSSDWDTYSSNYLYNHLNTKQKKFWDTLDFVCHEYLVKDLNAITYPYNWEYAYPEWKVLYGKMGLTEEVARNTFIMFAYSNPQYYFLDSAALPMNSNGEWIMFFYGKFTNGYTRKAETARVKAQINSMGKKIAKGKTEVEKAQIAHDLIIQSVKYDHYYKTAYAQSKYHQSAYSVFCEGYTVCAGYAKAFELLMNAAGIDTMAVTSTSHAWNLIRLNDSWYQVDCTWDDKDGANGYQGIYTYFCRKTSRIAGDLDQNSYHQMEYFYSKKVPKCTLDSGATMTSIGTYKAPTSQVKRPTISAKKVSGGMQVTIKTGTSGASIYYTLDGKEPSPSGSKCYRYTKPFKVSSNVRVRAIAVLNQKWDSTLRSVKVNGKMCTVKFNAMGGKKISSKKVHYQTTVKKPSAKRSGYKFVGWYTDKKCKKAWNFKKKVTKSMTLYAKWKKK